MATPPPIIVVKKQISGHAAPHGGAWKVAYSDFITSMMMFFLVMWLLASEKDVQIAVAKYFNAPTSAWRADLASKKTVPLGDKTGAGNDLLSGAGGGWPEDLVKRPSRPYQAYTEPVRREGNVSPILKESLFKMHIEKLEFSYLESALFFPEKTSLKPQAKAALKKLGSIIAQYPGKLQIEVFTLPVPKTTKEPYVFALSRAITLRHYFSKNRLKAASQIKTIVTEPPSKKAPKKRKVLFYLLPN